MSEYHDCAWQDPTITLPGEWGQPTREYRYNEFGRNGLYSIYYIQFTVPANGSDFRIYFDQTLSSSHVNFWAATELWFEVDGTRETKLQRSKESNELGYAAHFAFDQDAFGTFYNNKRVRFVMQTGTSQGVDSPFTFLVHQYT